MFSLPISKFSMINRSPLVSLEFQKTKPKLVYTSENQTKASLYHKIYIYMGAHITEEPDKLLYRQISIL